MDLLHTEGIITINFSKEILGIDSNLKEKMLEAITFSLLELDGINGIIIKVNGTNINELFDGKLPEVFTREYGINKKYDIKCRKNVKKVIMYYIDEINGEQYFVPITKYIDDTREKINIITYLFYSVNVYIYGKYDRFTYRYFRGYSKYNVFYFNSIYLSFTNNDNFQRVFYKRNKKYNKKIS